MFHSVPSVPRAKVERFAGVDPQICASAQHGCPKDFYEAEGLRLGDHLLISTSR